MIAVPSVPDLTLAGRFQDRVRATAHHRHRGRACASQVGSSRHRDRDRWSRCGLHDSACGSAARRLANRSHEDRNPWPYHPSDVNWKRDGRRLQVRSCGLVRAFEERVFNQPLADNWLTIGSGSRFPAVAPNREIPKKNGGQRSPAAPSCVGSFALGARGRWFEPVAPTKIPRFRSALCSARPFQARRVRLTRDSTGMSQQSGERSSPQRPVERHGLGGGQSLAQPTERLGQRG